MSLSPPLTRDSVRSLLATKTLGARIEVHQRLDSTNREAFALAQAGAEHGTVVVAEGQTHGRGRLGRSWFSPPGINLYCSIIVKTSASSMPFSQWLSWLPLATALGVAEAIEKSAGLSTALKWPNDLLVRERKIGGILCESGTTVSSGPFQVIGVGINVNGTSDDFPPDLRDSSTTIHQETGRLLDRNHLLSRLLLEVEDCLTELATEGNQQISIAYVRRCVTLGRPVRVSLAGGEEFTGIAKSVEWDGSLQVARNPASGSKRPADIRFLRAADIVHVRPGESED
jgi:BirA family biotin operon repressor/biotin-[acetyl-CoA-carboxylase] ligase